MASLTKINKAFNLIKDETQHQNYSESILFCNLVNFNSKLENPNTVFFNSWFELDGEDNFFEYSAAEYLEDLLKFQVGVSITKKIAEKVVDILLEE